MDLYPITATGIRAFCSDMILDPYELDTIYFMSICGYQATVKGVIANLLENYGISINIEGEEYYLTRAGFGYRTQVKKLPSGLVHAVLFPRMALPGNDEDRQNSFYVFTKEKSQILSLFYRHLDEETDIPLHPSWSRWLWNAFKEQDKWLVELKTMVGAFKGYSFAFNPKKLHDLISGAIRNRAPEIIRCMECKGGNEDGTSDFTQGIPE